MKCSTSGRMERENARMVQDEELLAEKRLKLDYQDLMSCDMTDVWDTLLENTGHLTQDQLREGVSGGVSKTRRGEVWQMMVSRNNKTSVMEHLVAKFPNLTTDYTKLKSQLTSHQHAILIDLGKTYEIFPELYQL